MFSKSYNYHLKIFILLNKKTYVKINNKIGTTIKNKLTISLIFEYLTETSEKIITTVPNKNKIILKEL